MIKISALKPGDGDIEIEAIINFVVMGKTNGNNRSVYLNMTLQDATGTIDARLWSASEEQIKTFTTGTIIQVQGDIIKYNEGRQMKIHKAVMLSKDPEEQVKYLKKAPMDADAIMQGISTYIDSMQNQSIQMITKTIFTKHYDRLKIYPAASKNHHEYVSGLGYHMFSMLQLAKEITVLYPMVNRDLLYAGVILHDLGKVIELSGPVVPEYTMEGKLLGHISICQAMIKEVANTLQIESEEVTLLQHMVLSHHGKYEFGSPVLPMLLEAEILYLIDNLDARIVMINKALETVEGGEFTKRVFSLENRSFYHTTLDK